MITCKSKEGVFDMLFVPLFAQPGSHQPECRPLGKVILRHFSCAFRTSSDKRFGAGSRGAPKPIQPMSLLNLGLWRLLAGFFPKAGIRLPLLRNFRNMRKRL